MCFEECIGFQREGEASPREGGRERGRERPLQRGGREGERDRFSARRCHLCCRCRRRAGGRLGEYEEAVGLEEQMYRRSLNLFFQ